MASSNISPEASPEPSLPGYLLEPISPDIELNCFLDILAQKIRPDELERLKKLSRGGFTKLTLHEVKDAGDFFECLRQAKLLTMDNLMHLQSLLWHLRRKDLFDSAVEFAQKIPETVYLVRASDEPVNGYKHVKFHIKGKDFSQFSRTDLDRLRGNFAKHLFCPPEFVLVDGIEPSSSILITFMVPVEFENVLETVMTEGLHNLIDIGVDWASVDGKIYHVDGSTQSLSSGKSEETKDAVFKRTFDQLQTCQQKKDEYETEVFRLTKALKEATTKLIPKVTAHASTQTEKPTSAVIKQLLDEYEKYLESLRQQKCNMTLIMNLVYCLTDLEMATVAEDYREQVLTQQKNLTAVQRQNFRLQIEKGQLLALLRAHTPEQKLELVPGFVDILKTVSKELTKEEIALLKSTEELNRKDTKDIQRHPDMFLVHLANKALSKMPANFIAGYISDLLRRVNRRDLDEKFLDLKRIYDATQLAQEIERAKSFMKEMGIPVNIPANGAHGAATNQPSSGDSAAAVLRRLDEMEKTLNARMQEMETKVNQIIPDFPKKTTLLEDLGYGQPDLSKFSSLFHKTGNVADVMKQ